LNFPIYILDSPYYIFLGASSPDAYKGFAPLSFDHESNMLLLHQSAYLLISKHYHYHYHYHYH
jgi:hypothetical protein